MLFILVPGELRVCMCRESDFDSLLFCGPQPPQILRAERGWLLFTYHRIPTDYRPEHMPFQTCISQLCRECRGYGLVHPLQVYNHVVTTGVLFLRDFSEDHPYHDEVINFLKDEWFPHFCGVEAELNCADCMFVRKCFFKKFRKRCDPIIAESRTAKVPLVMPKPKACVYPFLFPTADTVLLHVNASGKVFTKNKVFRQAYTDRKVAPPFVVAERKVDIAEQEVPHMVYELMWVYFLAKQFGLFMHANAFCPSTRIDVQLAFGYNFVKTVDYSSHLYRFAPIRRVPVKIVDVKVGETLKLPSPISEEVAALQPFFRPVFEDESPLFALRLALLRVFGVGFDL